MSPSTPVSRADPGADSGGIPSIDMNVDQLAAVVDEKFISGFIRARKPAITEVSE